MTGLGNAPENAPIIVLKFGSSVLSESSQLTVAVHEVYRYYRRGYRVLVVVSAIGGHTDRLLAEAQAISRSVQPDVALATLLASGEQQSAALMTMSLHRAGIIATLLNPAAIGLLLRGDRLDASPVSVDAEQVHAAFAAARVLVLPGFSGLHASGDIALMGRGGSDLTAVFLAGQLRARECRLVKDVDGIYERDPAATVDPMDEAPPCCFASVTCEDALRVAGVLVQPKAIEYLQAMGATAKVAALMRDDGTEVGARSTVAREPRTPRPLQVLLLGLGIVGRGVYHHLQKLGEFFEVAGIGVRDLSKSRAGVDAALLTDDLAELLARPHDLVVDVCADPVASWAALEHCLSSGRSAVTASKQVTAERGDALASMASQHGATFRFSAAVGGSAPMIEAVERAVTAGGIVRLRGVLNGTSNYVLDRLREGVTLENAVDEARAHGFAEADPSRDLSGEDSEDKLRILARMSFGRSFEAGPVLREGLETLAPRQLASASARGEVIRLVATVDASSAASVRLVSLPAQDYLAGAVGEHNRLVIECEDREWQVEGKGAGCWPTAESVLADMLDVHALANAGLMR